MFSWKCTGCEVAAPGYIKGKQDGEHNITKDRERERDPEIIQGEIITAV